MVGIHIHVSQVELGLINLHGLIKKTRQFPLSPGINEAAFTEMLIKELKAFISDINDVQIAAVGIGCLGLISFDKGEILNVEPLGWGPVPLAAQITNAVQLPVYIDNNVRAMTLAEKMFGESKQVSDFLCIYIGEGIGSGLILNDRLYRGGPTGSGEFGHMTYMPDGISCWCGNRGCLEQYASNTAISRQLQASWPRVLHAFEQGDSETVQAMRQAGRAIGTVLASYINILHVEKVVVAGVMAGPGFPLISELKKEIEWRSFLFKREKVQIESSSFGEHIGLIGAASLALQHEIFIR
ncbi:ROK family protein [Paenibacillus sp. EPM92]|uniref:ROK family protein n=1 Tax=Paenibacillus sp. EPM92 TaxID=1561195 RepID=UPI001915A367|nr:ROK family protein [Paenibacillus sp. EPM92]